MEKKDIGFKALIDVIGKEFCMKHKESSCFSWGDEDMGIFCFLGFDLHPEERIVTLSDTIENWDVYATCYVTDENEVIMDKCKLP